MARLLSFLLATTALLAAWLPACQAVNFNSPLGINVGIANEFSEQQIANSIMTDSFTNLKFYFDGSTIAKLVAIVGILQQQAAGKYEYVLVGGSYDDFANLAKLLDLSALPVRAYVVGSEPLHGLPADQAAVVLRQVTGEISRVQQLLGTSAVTTNFDFGSYVQGWPPEACLWNFGFDPNLAVRDAFLYFASVTSFAFFNFYPFWDVSQESDLPVALGTTTDGSHFFQLATDFKCGVHALRSQGINLDVFIGETGWATCADLPWATLENRQIYYQNYVRYMQDGGGYQLWADVPPLLPPASFWFELFNEPSKVDPHGTGPCWGLKPPPNALSPTPAGPPRDHTSNNNDNDDVDGSSSKSKLAVAVAVTVCVIAALVAGAFLAVVSWRKRTLRRQRELALNENTPLVNV